MKKLSFFLLGFLLILASCSTQKQTIISNSTSPKITYNERIAFYNVENLFDTIDQANVEDEEFLPQSKKKWNTERYQKKLDHITQVISALQNPLIIGFCEVENKGVLQDLVKHKDISEKKYEIVHYDSPDGRGIDCGLIYQSQHFKVTSSKPLKINFPEDIAVGGDGKRYATRDILRVDGLIENSIPITVFVNHWPSRGRDGQEKSEKRRVYTATVLKEEINSIQSQNTNANIVIMGDLNDETDNISITTTLGAKAPSFYSSSTLVDWMTPMDQEGKGTEVYQGKWNMLDHIISSSNMANPVNSVKLSNPTILMEDFLLYFDKKENQKFPSRTYGGDRYFGGYSDHLPVYITIKQ